MIARPIFTLCCLFCAAPSFAQEAAPNIESVAKATVITVSKNPERKPTTIDVEFCEKWLTTYLHTLDPRKLYFLSDDIAEFREHLDQLPKFASTGNLQLCTLVTKRYQLRVRSALGAAIKRLEGEFDFSIDEEIPLRFTDWPTTPKERTERWRLNLKYNLLVERSLPEAKDPVSFLKSRYKSILHQAETISKHRTVGLYLDSFCRTVDPHSNYITPKEFLSFFGGMLREHSIGLGLATNDGRTTIKSVAPGFRLLPAAPELIGCELLAIRYQNDIAHNLREIYPYTTQHLISSALNKEKSVKYRFAVRSSLDAIKLFTEFSALNIKCGFI